MIEHLDFIGEQSLDQRLFVIQLIKFHNVIIKSDTCNNNNNKFVLKTRDCPFDSFPSLPPQFINMQRKQRNIAMMGFRSVGE